MKKMLLLAAILFSPAALAHPFGLHGAGFAQGLAHPFLGLDHLLAMTAVGAWSAQQGGKAVWAVPATFVITMVVGALLALAGIPLPHIEAMIAASVLVLGLLVAFQFKLPLAFGMMVVSTFALFHGHAHATELPEAASPVLYALGFVIATTTLHVAGIASARLGSRWLRAAGALTAAAGVLFMLGIVTA